MTEEVLHANNAWQAMEKLVTEYGFHTVLDVGSGAGGHAAYFAHHGKEVTKVDIGKSKYFQDESSKEEVYIADFNDPEVCMGQYDVVWCSQVLEHQPNVQQFLIKLRQALKQHGILAITVPPLKHAIVGGHVTLWNAGLLLYNLILAGFDCSAARLGSYGYNISVIVRRPETAIDLPDLHFDSGDIVRLQAYFPIKVHEGFDGRLKSINW